MQNPPEHFFCFERKSFSFQSLFDLHFYCHCKNSGLGFLRMHRGQDCASSINTSGHTLSLGTGLPSPGRKAPLNVNLFTLENGNGPNICSEDQTQSSNINSCTSMPATMSEDLQKTINPNIMGLRIDTSCSPATNPRQGFGEFSPAQAVFIEL